MRERRIPKTLLKADIVTDNGVLYPKDAIKDIVAEDVPVFKGTDNSADNFIGNAVVFFNNDTNSLEMSSLCIKGEYDKDKFLIASPTFIVDEAITGENGITIVKNAKILSINLVPNWKWENKK